MSTTNTDDLASKNIPIMVKCLAFLIRDVGFPVMAFLLMFYMSYVSLEKASNAIEANTKAMLEFSITTREFQLQVDKAHDSMQRKLDSIPLGSIVQKD